MQNSVMVKSRAGLILLAFLLIITSCATKGRKERAELRELFNSRQFPKAQEFLGSAEFYKDQKQALLKYLELGLTHHAAGQYYQSVLALNKAKEIHQQLFTISLSKKAATLVTNDTVDQYYGEPYERSLIHFYLALNHYLLHQRGTYESYIPEGGKEPIAEKILTPSERNTEIQAARAETIAWDSYLDWLQKDRTGKSVFKNDLLAKTFGAFIHEAMGSRNELQTALLLYIDAKKILFQNYNAYKTFNGKAPKFKGDFSKLPGLAPEKVAAEYVEPTQFQKDLKDYLDYKILQLTKLLRPGDVEQMKKIHNPSEGVIKEALKSRPGNVTVLFQRGMIPSKIASTQYYSLESALTPDNPSAAQKQVAQIGAGVITLFAANQLGLLPPPNNFNPVGMELGVRLGFAAGNLIAISFELPVIEKKEIQENVEIEVTDMAGKSVAKRRLPVINPLVDVAMEAVAENSAALYTRLGARLASKHLTAIMASFGTYSLMKDKSGEFFAKQAALLQYIGASKAIAASEQADTRFWSTLPADIRLIEFSLPKGKYQIKANVTGPNLSTSYSLGEIDVQSEKEKKLVNFRSP
jgi:hypothetical protein